MSTKAYTLIIIGAGLLLLIGGFFLGWNVKPAPSCPVIDSTLVKTDTAWIRSDTTYTAEWSLPAQTDTVPSFMGDGGDNEWVAYTKDDLVKSSSIDTIFCHNEDAIRVQATVSYNLLTDTFDWLMNIEHKDFQLHTTDTLKVYLTETVEIQTTDPMWVLLSIAEFFLIILAIIF